jgi:hypothetical protein
VGEGEKAVPRVEGAMARGSEVRGMARFEHYNEQEEILQALRISGLCERDVGLHLKGQWYRERERYVYVYTCSWKRGDLRHTL